MKNSFLFTIFIGCFLPAIVKAQCNTFFSSTTVCSGTATTFYDSSFIYTPSDSIVKEIWNYGDGTADTFSLYQYSHTHIYNTGGIYNTKQIIFTTNACSSSYTNVTKVKSNPPIADSFYFTHVTSCVDSLNVQFYNNSNATGTLKTYWYFGDVSSVTTLNPLHSYISPGNYTVELVTLVSGCTSADTAFKKLILYGPIKAAFSFNVDNSNPELIHFIDATTVGTYPIVRWFWDFGDGDTSSAQNPSHIYSVAGTYSVKHVSQNVFGCISDTLNYPLYVDSVNITTGVGMSNMGKDFWAGFAYEQDMTQNQSAGGAKNILYIAAGNNAAIVTISLPGLLTANGFPQVLSVPANSVVTVTGFPTGDPNEQYNAIGLPDTRLYFTGITNRAIHITSNELIDVWQYDYALNNSAGASLLLPTQLWSNNYSVQAMGGLSNTPNPNSFFYVIAEQDSTKVNFIPSNDIADSSGATIFASGYPDSSVLYHAGNTYTITLNKGQVFNAMGFIKGSGNGTSLGLDLSGTIISSLDPTKKIAVFGGNGRCLVSTPVSCPNPTAGSDNMVQQMMSTLYWDTKYFSVPTKSMAHNLYRIYVQNAATKIWTNDTAHITTPLTGLVVPGNYYVYESSYPTLFESDEPISITQFMTSCSGNNAIGNNGSGDPEMIILTSTQEAINSATVYSPMIQDGTTGGAYVNVIIPKAGIATFNLDNLTSVDTGTSSFSGVAYGSAASIPIANAFKPYPADSNYYFATFHVGNGTIGAIHTMSASVPFNSIVYGCAGGESYGFNAGCTLNHLHNVYTFTGNGNWSDSTKWLNNQLPPSDLPIGSEVIISGNCILDILQTLEYGSTLTILTGADLKVNGDLLIQK